MGAKDTVMSESKIRTTYISGCTDNELCDETNGARAVAKAQSEISFKAGIREVVEWIGKQIAFEAMLPEWQAKLKEWGIQEDKEK